MRKQNYGHTAIRSHGQAVDLTSQITAPKHPLVHLQQQFGNQHVMRLLAGANRSHIHTTIIQRDDRRTQNGSIKGSSNSNATDAPLKEEIVPIPVEHPVKSASSAAGSTEEIPTPPEQARIRVPINLKFHLLPPEMRLQLLDDLNLTAKVNAANLQWQRDRLNLGLHYGYGGKLSGQGSYQTDFGTFSGKGTYDPSSASARFDLGFEQEKWRASVYGTTDRQFGAEFSYGMKPPPSRAAFEESVRGGGEGVGNILTELPEVANPANLPATMTNHGEDFSKIGDAASSIVDLTKHDTHQINWGFYLRFSKGPYTPSEWYSPAYDEFKGMDEYKGEIGIQWRP